MSNLIYTVIYADPPWPYDNPKNNDPAMGGYTYPAMSLDQIERLPVGDLAAENCALFLWATYPKLPEVLAVIDAWGFTYTTVAFTWVKTTAGGDIYSGLGHWTNGNAELCLFAKRGRPVRYARNVKQIIMAPPGPHSAKPPETRRRIERLMGPVHRVELFARETIPGWSAWGNEAGLAYDLALVDKQWQPAPRCPACDKIVPLSGKGRKRTYCNDNCKRQFWRRQCPRNEP